MSEFLMPSLGSDMEAGTLVEQSIAPGQPVARGDVIGAVETQKGVIEIEVFQDGVLDAWLVDLGTKVPVGAPLAMIRKTGAEPEPRKQEPKSEIPMETKPSSPETKPEPIQAEAPTPELNAASPRVSETSALKPDLPSPSETTAPSPESEPRHKSAPIKARAKITPAARRLAAAHGIDLDAIKVAPGAAITRRDVEAMRPAKESVTTTDFRTAIAAAMSRSKKEIPHYYLSHDIDLTAADTFVGEQNAGRDPSERLLLGAVCAKAVASALVKFPEFNGHYVDNEFNHSEAVHLGFAINIRSGGLVAPALFDADSQSLGALMQSMRDLTARVRAGRFRARELSDATVTLTSLGERGTDAVFGVIYPPQVAIIGMGAPGLRPSVHGDTITPRLMTTLTLAADHRVSDGYRGALLLRAIDKQLQKPETL